MLLWASKFATAKIECSFEMGNNCKLLWGNIYFAGNGNTSDVRIRTSGNNATVATCCQMWKDVSITHQLITTVHHQKVSELRYLVIFSWFDAL